MATLNLRAVKNLYGPNMSFEQRTSLKDTRLESQKRVQKCSGSTTQHDTTQASPSGHTTHIKCALHKRHNKLNKRSIWNFNKRPKCSICRFSLERQHTACKETSVQEKSRLFLFCKRYFYTPVTVDLDVCQETTAPSSKRERLLTVWPLIIFVSPLFGIACLRSIKHL